MRYSNTCMAVQYMSSSPGLATSLIYTLPSSGSLKPTQKFPPPSSSKADYSCCICGNPWQESPFNVLLWRVLRPLREVWNIHRQLLNTGNTGLRLTATRLVTKSWDFPPSKVRFVDFLKVQCLGVTRPSHSLNTHCIAQSQNQLLLKWIFRKIML